MTDIGKVSESLEDYLKIIFQLERERRVARVKDIAARKGVSMASVTSALRRMSKDGLVRYGAREFVELSEMGRELARKVLQRHDFIRRFLTRTLGLPQQAADKDADALEHHLSAETLERLVAFYQFISSYGLDEALSRYLEDGQTVPCDERLGVAATGALKALGELKPGGWGRVAWLEGDASHRLQLIDKGIMPRVRIEMESRHEGHVQVKIKGISVGLTDAQATSVRMQPISREEGLASIPTETPAAR
jgi:Mn-dependent DtxR family transcriptional regulator